MPLTAICVSFLQVAGDLFYERCGFFAGHEGSEAPEDRVLYYQSAS